MKLSDCTDYLDPVLEELRKMWPDNRTVRIVCHGHSVPAGYFATPYVNTFNSYPYLLHSIIKERFPFAVVNVIVTAVGGENSSAGLQRFETEVLNHNPDVLTIDYALNDRGVGLEAAKAAWDGMIKQALSRNIKVILLTPNWDTSYLAQNHDWQCLLSHADQIREMAAEHEVALADVFKRFEEYVKEKGDLVSLLSGINHPSRIGHEIIANEIAKYFMAG